MSELRVGVLGGTFDPVHFGHLSLMRQAQAALDLDHLLIVPTHVPPHKTWAPYASFEARYQMLTLAVADAPDIIISVLEKQRGDISYTVDTIEMLRASCATCSYYFITGADAYRYFTTWRRWRELLDLCHLVVAKRPGFSMEGNVELDIAARESRNGMIFLDIDTPDVSSTDIRHRLAHGESVKHLMPAVVEDYIRSNGLYTEHTHD